MNAAGRHRIAWWAGPLLVGFVFAALSWRTWGKWPDLLIDFGMQLYVPWQLASGSVLYRDIMYLPGGPLSQYYHAFLFTLFDPSLRVLVISNHVIAALLIIVIYRCFAACADRLTAVAASLAVVVVFVFPQYFDTGNYNYICPYSHEAVHGLVLSILMLAALARWQESGSRAALGGAGVCLGAVFLTKPEIFVAAAMAAVAGWVLRRLGSEDRRRLLPESLLFIGLALLPALIVFAGFSARVGWRDGLKSVGWAWLPLLESDVSRNEYYRWCLGLDVPWTNAGRMLLYFIVFVAVLAVLVWRLRCAPKTAPQRILLVSLVGVMSLGVVFFDWTDCGRPLPLITAGVLMILIWRYRLAGAPWRMRLAFPLMWFVFALFLLAKMGLHARIWHYGFVLAMPAFVGAVYFLFWLLPEALGPSRCHQGLLRGALGVLITIACLRLLAQSEYVHGTKNHPIGEGGDRFLAFSPGHAPESRIMVETLEWIEENVSPHQTLAALPEGAMINYLSRRANSTPYLVFMAEVEAFGDDVMLAAYQQHSPDYILLVHRDSSEFGYRLFGQERGYGLDMMRWIEKEYRPVHLIGHEPLRSHRFGVKIFRRIE